MFSTAVPPAWYFLVSSTTFVLYVFKFHGLVKLGRLHDFFAMLSSSRLSVLGLHPKITTVFTVSMSVLGHYPKDTHCSVQLFPRVDITWLAPRLFLDVKFIRIIGIRITSKDNHGFFRKHVGIRALSQRHTLFRYGCSPIIFNVFSFTALFFPP